MAGRRRGGDGSSLAAAFESSPAGRFRALGQFLVGTYAGAAVLAVVVGLSVAPFAASVALSGSSGTVAVVPVEGAIDGGTAVALTTTIVPETGNDGDGPDDGDDRSDDETPTGPAGGPSLAPRSPDR